jgi:NAD(P)-dependent dehydrogenase (short-subunit alcohol dehydrogenase family)
VVTSMGALNEVDERLLGALLDDTEEAARAVAQELIDSPSRGMYIYNTSKRALARWVRRVAASAEWAGRGIPLNAVAPGLTETPMVYPPLDSEENRRLHSKLAPSPLNGPQAPIVQARLLAWLVSPENTHLCGQVIYNDGGADVSRRGDSVW